MYKVEIILEESVCTQLDIYCVYYFVERSAAIIGRPARVIGSISQKVITLPDGVITTYFLQLLDCLCYLSAINSMNTFIT